MIIEKTEFNGLYVSKLDKKEDERGYFARFYCFEEYLKLGLIGNISQANIASNKKANTFRGMHYQIPPHQETKIITCLQGSLIDFVIDLRKDEPTYKKSFHMKLDSKNRKSLIIPKGFAHGYLTLEDKTEVFYLVDEPFNPSFERGIRWNDTSFNIDLPENPEIVSEKDSTWENFKEEL